MVRGGHDCTAARREREGRWVSGGCRHLPQPRMRHVSQAAGYTPTVIEYLKTGWTRAQLLGLFAAAITHASARSVCRIDCRLEIGPTRKDDASASYARVWHPTSPRIPTPSRSDRAVHALGVKRCNGKTVTRAHASYRIHSNLNAFFNAPFIALVAACVASAS